MVNAEALVSTYRRRFDGDEPTVVVRAPGRVNLIGDHVDYNEGLVLPIAIDRATYAAAGPNKEGKISVFSAALGETAEFGLHDDHPPNSTGWDAYPMGVAAELTKANVTLTGTRIYIDGDLPIGAGLSSSAAFEVAVALSLLSVASATLPPRRLARVCRLAEHHYAGVPCGIMDQYACTMAVADAAMLLDCQNEQIEHIPWPSGDAIALIVDSRCGRRLSDGAYADHVRQCTTAVEQLQQTDPAVRSLRDVSQQQLAQHQAAMDPTRYRRARHVVTEIQRTREAAQSLRHADLDALGRLMNESHASLHDDYEASSPQLDDLAEAVRSVPGVFGARMTGAGFGGCVVALAERAAVTHVDFAVKKCYDTKYGTAANLMITRACQGATVTMISPT